MLKDYHIQNLVIFKTILVPTSSNKVWWTKCALLYVCEGYACRRKGDFALSENMSAQWNFHLHQQSKDHIKLLENILKFEINRAKTVENKFYQKNEIKFWYVPSLYKKTTRIFDVPVSRNVNFCILCSSDWPN